MSQSFPLYVRHLGKQQYEPVWRAMQSFTQQRGADTPDELWLLQHTPVYTLGLNGKRKHLLIDNGIPVIDVDRGGQVTYHGPGQLVIYTLIDLERKQLGVRDLVQLIEQAIINLLDDFSISANRKSSAPGVYINGAKIAALGLRIKKGCSYHGLSLNIAMDLAPFQAINPCGYEGMPVCQLKELTSTPTSLDDVALQLTHHLARLLQYDELYDSHEPPTQLKALL